MKKYLPIFLLMLLSACTPRVVQYCEGKGLQPQTPEWAQCYAYFERNEARFRRDRLPCEQEAERVYPDSLYDHGYYVRRPVFRQGMYVGSHIDNYPGDWWHNRQMDNLRHGIIAECMARKGWNDADKWELGGKKLR